MTDEFQIQQHSMNDQWIQICDRLERLGIRPVVTDQMTFPEVLITDGERKFRLIDILDKFIDLMERA